ncbi:diaminopimelate decarboxylase [Sphingomonas sp. Sph1(2015)]|jgi:diaminopimelate decarboxylase|uniref:diaminopimelate decarboxylase n=1 Tax=Sphingomonas sp. Sph1(2015) TaxID=1628084 RepID=UPI000977E9C3|nr:diaminopimelate decarboxylase [Sphingomonas sp. Sph1(2015)]OMJ33868.1 diaminopimelate decarboxylase [Sphingomonas sp. Sph1(2015)]
MSRDTGFVLRGGALHAEGVALGRIAQTVGTPTYVYSAGALRAAARRFREALAPIPRKSLAFAVKANPSLAVLSVLRGEGFGADIVSGGELTAALAAGMAAGDIVYSGVGKTPEELAQALHAGVGHVNLESEREGDVLAATAVRMGVEATAMLRVNPDVDGGTHAKITTGTGDSKFGVAFKDAIGIFDRLARRPGLTLHGVAVHIGSQIMDLKPLETACRRIGELVAALRARGHVITHVDLGGGLGVDYHDGPDGDVAAYGEMVARVTHDWDVTLMFEPGRYIAAHAGVLLTRVLWVKPGEECPFVVIDAGMNDLARPALYDAWHEFAAVAPNGATMRAHVVGPVCESSDRFAKGRLIDRVREGDLAVLRDAGAYGASMASCYNSRALAAEVMVEGDRFAVIAPRIDAAAIRPQSMPDWLEARRLGHAA